MSRKSSSNSKWWFALLLAIVIYGYLSFWASPPMISKAPEQVSVEMLLQHPERYQNKQVMLKNGLVNDSYYFLGRCFFGVTDTKNPDEIWAISPVYHQSGTSLDNTVFKFKIIYCSDDHFILLLQEVRSN